MQVSSDLRYKVGEQLSQPEVPILDCTDKTINITP
jgi:hypothetical protein